MGNCCSSSSNPADPFAQPGRTLSSAAPPSPSNQKPTSSVPKKVGGPPRTLGGPSPGSDEASDARRKAAEAAEARMRNSNKPKGKLSAQLQEQKKQTRVDTLEEASRNERLARAADEGAQTRAYN
ncbi:hypothetical protein CJF32_00005548 [Rutstroemia sp. NJR-2017a WRK4]|nr:hypothetical protein CJF32_00005548 [Rutstroemia sp. NJR-2017a WRK4]